MENLMINEKTRLIPHLQSMWSLHKENKWNALRI